MRIAGVPLLLLSRRIIQAIQKLDKNSNCAECPIPVDQLCAASRPRADFFFEGSAESVHFGFTACT